ncbi:hypothetical protein F9038_23885 [Escherichia coli]|nr:hypothetical protein F9038_23885 [Escherichia coli]
MSRNRVRHAADLEKTYCHSISLPNYLISVHNAALLPCCLAALLPCCLAALGDHYLAILSFVLKRITE